MLRDPWRLQALGVQPAPGALRARPLFREDPALHPLLARLRVPARGDLLLHLCPQPRERRALPEAARLRLLQRHHTGASDGGSQFTASRARGAGGRGARPGYRSPAAAPHPVPCAHAPGPALDLIPRCCPWWGDGLLCPTACFRTLPPPPSPRQAHAAALGHNSPAGPPQSRAGARSSTLEGTSLPTGIDAHRPCRPPCPGAGLPKARRTPALPQGRRLILCLPPWTPRHRGQGPPGPGARRQLLQAPLSSGEDTRSVFWEDALLHAVTGPFGLVLTPGSD